MVLSIQPARRSLAVAPGEGASAGPVPHLKVFPPVLVCVSEDLTHL